ncbi:MAG: hypothetical protein GQE15_28525 [Archangiaceae bacterium]|nr:hypothetical protein [Archangiaceae bacterium]
MRRTVWVGLVLALACPRRELTAARAPVVDAGATVVDAGDTEAVLQVALNRALGAEPSGGPAVELAPLEPHEPAGWRVHLKTSFPGGRVEVGTRTSRFGETDDDQFFNGGDDVVRLVARKRDVDCPLTVSASCATAPAVQTRGEFTLVCLPQDVRHDGCASSGFSVDWSRQCVLFDATRGTCALLPFVDARLESATRLEVEQTFSRLPRLPTTFADVVGSAKLGCGSGLCTHCPPDSLVRLELDLVDGGIELHRVVGELTCGEQSCDRQTNAELHPPRIGCR